MKYTLPKLTFAYDALEPFIDEKTLRVHHDGHHQKYVEELNRTLESYPDFQKPVEELLASLNTLPTEIKTAVSHNAGGHANHSLFWKGLTPSADKGPSEEFSHALGAFGGFAEFQKKFASVAIEHFSNGWVWLVEDTHGKLTIMATKDHENPITQGFIPLLVLDVWEHAYYLKYQNRRPDFIHAFWKIVDWAEVERRWHDVENYFPSSGQRRAAS